MVHRIPLIRQDGWWRDKNSFQGFICNPAFRKYVILPRGTKRIIIVATKQRSVDTFTIIGEDAWRIKLFGVKETLMGIFQIWLVKQKNAGYPYVQVEYDE